MIQFGMQREKASARPWRVDMWAPGQQAAFETLWPILKKGVAGPAPRYPGEMYVPRTEEEEAYLGYTTGEGMEARRAALGQILSGRVPYEMGPEWAEKYFEEGIRPIAMREWGEVTEPMIREAYAGPGYWGSARAGAQVKGAERLAEELTSAKAGLMYGEEQAMRAAREAALGRQAQFGFPAAAAESGIMGTAAQYSRMIDQEKVMADLQRWLMGEEVDGAYAPQYNPFIQLVFQLLGLDPYALGQREKASSWGFGLGVGGLGGAGGGGGGGGSSPPT